MPEKNVPRFSEIGIMLPTGENVDKTLCGMAKANHR
ncbi:hypothetical protein ABID39_001083 [Bartonella japonica]|uniref:Uncharacterized protein n=1 Tax=Bartonella japonica TaxID=357761 RepID=A0ABV2FP92_9HYPH